MRCLIVLLALSACGEPLQPRAGIDVDVTPRGTNVNPSLGVSLGGLDVRYRG